MDEYVNWDAGTVHFDTGDFAQLLEFANRFPAEFDWMDETNWVDMDTLIATGRQIMVWTSLWDFQSFKWQRDWFGGEVVFKGFPADSRSGSSFVTYFGLAITTRSSHKDGAWEFLREFLTSDWQRNNARWSGFPVNKEVFDEMAAESMVERDGWGGVVMPRPVSRVVVDDIDIDTDEDSDEDADDGFDDDWGWDDGWWSQDVPLTQQEVDQINGLINSINHFANTNDELLNIIKENASDFFNGLRSAQDTARIIQSRVSRLISEQS